MIGLVGHDRQMLWQQQMAQEVAFRLPTGASLQTFGSVRTPSLVDGWSDLDLLLRLPHPVWLADLLGGRRLWAAEVSAAPAGQVVRAVLTDGRRLDLAVESGQLLLPDLARDNDVRFRAALAATKLGRGDRLIGTHLLLEILQACLVQAMVLRDRDEGTTLHRTGGPRDDLAVAVAGLLQLPLSVLPRPNLVEEAVELYGRWRGQVEADYRPDWEGLRALLVRGLS
jgi:hypothetical protein